MKKTIAAVLLAATMVAPGTAAAKRSCQEDEARWWVRPDVRRCVNVETIVQQQVCERPDFYEHEHGITVMPEGCP